MSNIIANTDIPNIRVLIREGENYSVNVVRNAHTTLRSGSYIAVAEIAVSASYANTASYAEAINSNISGSITFGNDVTVQDISANTYILKAGNVSLTFTGSINSGLFGVSHYVHPYIDTTKYSGTTIEYIAQRPDATRIGIIMATWLNNNVVFTDVSTADIGNTEDISFTFLKFGNEFRLRVNSIGSGSGTWTVQSLFKLFPNLTT